MIEIHKEGERELVSSHDVYNNISTTKVQYQRWLNQHVLGFGIEGIDYIDKGFHPLSGAGRKSREVLMTIDFAKGLCQYAGTASARKLRTYLLTL